MWLWWIGAILCVPHGLFLLAQAAGARGWTTMELQLLLVVLRLPGSSRVGSRRFKSRQWAAGLLMDQHRYTEAALHLEVLLLEPVDAATESWLRRLLAKCLDGMGQKSRGQEEREEAADVLRHAEPSMDVLEEEGTAAYEAGDLKRAIACFEKALDLAPGRTLQRCQIMVQLGTLYMMAGRPLDSLQLADRALNERVEHPLLALAWQLKVHAHLRLGDLEEASAALEHAQRGDHPPERTARLKVIDARIRMYRGQVKAALATCREVSEGGQERPSALDGAEADCWVCLGCFDDALKSLRQGLDRLSPAARAARELDMCVLLAEAGRGEEALAVAGQRDTLHDADRAMTETWAAIVYWIHCVRGKPDDAFEQRWLASAALVSPDSDGRFRSDIAVALGHAAVCRGDWAEARALWQRYLDEKPFPVCLPKAWYHLGLCHARQGHLTEARYYLEQASASRAESWYTGRAAELLRTLEERD